MQRGFGFDLLACPRCAGQLTLAALTEDSAVNQRIPRHLGLPAGVPEMRPSRASPLTVARPEMRPAWWALGGSFVRAETGNGRSVTRRGR
ncbi:MAG: hypothetical protein RJA55_2991 [Acidobacteriota bacterium]|jgi:uncharacterized protein YbaR (Trm112 family)